MANRRTWTSCDVSVLLDSTRVEYRDLSTFFKEYSDEWPLRGRESIRKYIESWVLYQSSGANVSLKTLKHACTCTKQPLVEFSAIARDK